MSHDPRIEVPEGLRNAGIFGGIIMMVLGLIIAWRRSGMSVPFPPTGGPRPLAPEVGRIDRIIDAIVGRIQGKKEKE